MDGFSTDGNLGGVALGNEEKVVSEDLRALDFLLDGLVELCELLFVGSELHGGGGCECCDGNSELHTVGWEVAGEDFLMKFLSCLCRGKFRYTTKNVGAQQNT